MIHMCLFHFRLRTVHGDHYRAESHLQAIGFGIEKKSKTVTGNSVFKFFKRG